MRKEAPIVAKGAVISHGLNTFPIKNFLQYTCKKCTVYPGLNAENLLLNLLKINTNNNLQLRHLL